MKTALCCVVAFSVLPLFAQVNTTGPAHSGRYYARKAGVAEKRKQETEQALNAPAEGAASAPAQAPAATQPAAQPQTNSNKTKVAIPQKTAEEKQDIIQRTVAIQRKRAERGDAIAQYDLGMRLMRGEGVEKNMDEAVKWLHRSADQGNSLAKKQIEDLDKKASEPATAKDETAEKK
jgi:TPR repeat protein